MKKIYRVIKAALWCCAGFFAAVCVQQTANYMLHPEKYIYSSAPWYTNIEICGIFTAIIAALLFAGLVFVKREMK